jgi:F-type H+-transporting ATPase subunit delta
MSRRTSARRYAQAAFELAQEGAALDKWREDIWHLAGLLANEELRDYLDAPLIPDVHKIQTLKELRPDGLPLVHNLAGLLLKNGLVSLLPLVAQEFQTLIDQQQGIARARVTTAIPIDSDVVESIRQQLQEITAMDVEVTVEVSPSILGGFVAQVGDRLIDGSVRNRLKQLRGRMQSA